MVIVEGQYCRFAVIWLYIIHFRQLLMYKLLKKKKKNFFVFLFFFSKEGADFSTGAQRFKRGADFSVRAGAALFEQRGENPDIYRKMGCTGLLCMQKTSTSENMQPKDM